MTKHLTSEILNLPIKLDTETGIITVKELKKFGNRGYVKYSGEEVKILSELGGVTPGIHMVKSIFDGEIIRKGESNDNS